jgi:hypothetical protein
MGQFLNQVTKQQRRLRRKFQSRTEPSRGGKSLQRAKSHFVKVIPELALNSKGIEKVTKLRGTAVSICNRERRIREGFTATFARGARL